MSKRRTDPRTELAPLDEMLVRRVADLYAAPPLSAARRARFDARLAERLDAPAPRGRAPLATLASGAAALALALGFWMLSPRGSQDEPTPSTRSTPLAVAPQDDDAILAMMEPIASADEALPDDYRAISALVIGE